MGRFCENRYISILTRILFCYAILAFLTIHNHLLSILIDIGHIDTSVFLIRFTLIQLLLYTTATFNSIFYNFIELFICWLSCREQQLDKARYGFLKSTVIASFNVVTLFSS